MKHIVYYCRNLHPLVIYYNDNWEMVGLADHPCHCGGVAVRYPHFSYYFRDKKIVRRRYHLPQPNLNVA